MYVCWVRSVRISSTSLRLSPGEADSLPFSYCLNSFSTALWSFLRSTIASTSPSPFASPVRAYPLPHCERLTPAIPRFRHRPRSRRCTMVHPSTRHHTTNVVRARRNATPPVSVIAGISQVAQLAGGHVEVDPVAVDGSDL